MGRVAKGAANLKIQEAVYCRELKTAIERVERIGIPLRNPDSGEFYRTQSMGQPGPYWINFNGKRLKPKMAKEVNRLGCRVLNRVQVTNLFLHDGELAGFTGFNIRTGDVYEVQAKAVSICDRHCPLDVFDMENDALEVRYPYECWHCGACRQDCPTDAVSIEFPLIMLSC